MASPHHPSRKFSDVPVKLRRRQSDAKWRANVANCYETLKLIIPVNKRASRRQISRAHILQQTEKHIQFLEDILASLLLEKAQRDEIKDATDWKEQKIEQIKKQFAQIHRQKIDDLNLEKRYKKKSYKLFIPEDMMQQDLQQTAQLRSTLIQKSENMRSSLEDEDHENESTFSSEKSHHSQRKNELDHTDYQFDNDDNSDDEIAEVTSNVQQTYDFQPTYLYGEPQVVNTQSNINKRTLHTIIQQSGACHYAGGCVMIPAKQPTVQPLLSANDTRTFSRGYDNHRSSTVSVCSDIQKVPDLNTKHTAVNECSSGKQPTVKKTYSVTLYSMKDQQVPLTLADVRHKSYSEDLSKQDDHEQHTKKNIKIYKSTSETVTATRSVIKTPVKRPQDIDITPRKQQKRDEHQGFTPVKLPGNWPLCSDITSPVSGHHNLDAVTPIKHSPLQLSPSQTLPGTPDSVGLLEAIDSDEEGLLCTEEMWLSDEDNDDVFPDRFETPNHGMIFGTELRNMKKARLDRSFRDRFESSSSQISSCSSEVKKSFYDKECDPNKEKKKKSFSTAKCRRSLQGLYDSPFVAMSSPKYYGNYVDELSGREKPCLSESEANDFDGYLQFYKNLGQTFEQKDGTESSSVIYEAWKQQKIASKELFSSKVSSKRSSQDSGFSASPMNLPELSDLDNGVWPLSTDIDVNAADEQNLLEMDPDLWVPQKFGRKDSVGVVPDMINMKKESVQTGYLQLEDSTGFPLLPHSNDDYVEQTNKTDAECGSNLSHCVIENNISEIHPIFVLDKDLWLQSEPCRTVDEELDIYLGDFSPPSKKNLVVL